MTNSNNPLPVLPEFERRELEFRRERLQMFANQLQTVLGKPLEFFSYYTPSPKEIAAKCLEIQEGWSEQTRHSRLTKGQGKHKTLSARMSGKYSMKEEGYVDSIM